MVIHVLLGEGRTGTIVDALGITSKNGLFLPEVGNKQGGHPFDTDTLLIEKGYNPGMS